MSDTIIEEKISDFPPIVTVNDNIVFACDDGATTKSIKQSQIKNDVIVEAKSELILSGSGAPSSTPGFVGQRYIDTTGDREYFAVGIASSADWRKVARYAFGTQLVLAGAGDVTVNLDFEWIDGYLEVHSSEISTNYFASSTNEFFMIKTSYEAITNVTYTDKHGVRVVVQSANPAADQNNVGTQTKNANLSGTPKSAGTRAFTLDDDGVRTKYIKWLVIA